LLGVLNSVKEPFIMRRPHRCGGRLVSATTTAFQYQGRVSWKICSV